MKIRTKQFFPLLLALTIAALAAAPVRAATVTTAGSGDWDSTTPNAPWPGGVVPATGDDVIITLAHSITVPTDATINSITFNNTAGAKTLTVNASATLSVTAAILMQNAADAVRAATIAGAGTITAASLTVGGSTTATGSAGRTTTLTSSIGSLTLSGNLNLLGQDVGTPDNDAILNLVSGTISVGGVVTWTQLGQCAATLNMNTGAETGTLILSGATPFSGTGTLTFDPNGTGSTVEYSGAAQTVRPVAYRHLTLSGSDAKTLTGVGTVSSNMTLSGSATATTAANFSIGGNLSIGDGSTFTAAGFDLTVTGTTTVGEGATGNLTISSTAGTKLFTGLVTVNAGATWDNTANEDVTSIACITKNATGTFNAGTGVHTFNTSSQTLTGTFSIPNVTVTAVALTNSGTLTISAALSGTGGLTQGAGATLNLEGTSGITTLTAAASGNVVNYDGTGAQTVKGATYNDLTVSGGNTKTLGAATVINGDLTIGSVTTLDVSASNFALSVGGAWSNSGTFIERSGTVTLNGTSAQSLTWAATFSGLTINNSAGVTLNSAITVNGTLTLTSGQLDNSGSNVTLGNGATISRATGTLAVVPSFGTTVNVTYTTGGVTTGPELPVSTTQLQVLSINNASGTVTLGAAATVNGALTIVAGGTLADGGFTLTVESTVANSGTHSSSGSGEMLFAGSAAQTITGVFGNVELNNAAGTSIGGTTTINGNLAVTAGTFTANQTLTVGGSTTIASTLTLGTTGTKSFGDVTVQVGGTWNNSANEAVTIVGNLANNATFTAGTSAYTLSGVGKTITGTISIPTLTISGTSSAYVNNGTLTVGTALTVTSPGVLANNGTITATTTLTGTGTLTQGTGATLNLGGATTSAAAITTLLASGGSNTVNYNLAGAQTVKPTTYRHLALSGSGAKTMTSVPSIFGDLTVSGSATITGNTFFTLLGALNYGSSGSSTLTAATPISIGTFNQTAGTLIDSGSTITVTGTGANTWVRSGGTFTATGTATFTGAAPEIGTANFNNLTINVGAGNTATLSGAVTVAGTLTLTSGTLDAGSNLTMGVGANIARSGGDMTGTPQGASAYSVTYTGSSKTTGTELAGSGLNNVTNSLTAGQTLTLDQNRSPDGNLTLTSGIFDLVGNTINRSAAGGTLSVAAGATLLVGGAANFPTNYSTVTLNATSTVNYDNAGAQTVSAQTYGHLTISGSGTKTLAGTIIVNGDLTISAGTLDTANNAVTLNGNFSNSGTFTAGSSAITIGGTGTQTIAGFTTTGTVSMTKTGGTATLAGIVNAGALTINGTGGTLNLGTGLTHTFTGTWTRTAGTLNGGSSTLNLGGTTVNTAGAFTAGTGTVNYNAAGAQTVAFVTYNNLTLSGSGIKTTTTITVTGILLMEGTATASAAPTYGAAATLQYNTATARTAGAEWITPFAATGGVIIDNTGAITLNAAKVFNTSIPLTINSSATLDTGNFALTFGGNFINNGTFTAGSSAITISGTGTQSIDGFTTTGGVTMTKTGGTATLAGNVDGGALTLNGSGGTLHLGTGLTHTFTGAWTRSNGTLNGGSSTLKIGGSVSGSTGTFTASTGTVEWNGAAQTIAGVTYNNLTLSGSGIKTPGAAITVNAAFTIGAATTFSVGGFTTHTIPGGGSIIVNGTLDFADAAGLIRSGTSGTSTLTMGSGGLIRTIDDLGLGPVASGSFVTQAGGAWDTTSISTAGTVEYNRNATSGQTVTDRDYNNLTITGSTQTKTWTIAATRTVNGDLTINTSAPLTMSGAQILNVKGNWSNSGTFTPGAVTVNFNKTGTQSVVGSSTTTFKNVTVASGAVLAVGAANANASQLRLNGINQALGTWGATGSGAAHVNNTFFSGTSGTLNVSRTATAIGSNTSVTSGTTIVVTVPAEGVAVDNTVIVTVAMDATAGSVTVADAGGNTYTLDQNITNGSGATGVRTLVFSAPVTTALVSANSITVTMPTTVAKAVSASYFSGLLTTTPVDQAASATGTSTTPSSGNTATTTQPDELVIGAIGVEESSSTTTLTPGSGYTALAQSGSTTGVRILPEYKIVSALATYAGDGTLSASRDWAAAVVTYKMLPGELDHFAISAISSPQTTGTPFNITTITAQDANNNTVTSFGGTVTFGGTAGVTGTSAAFTSGVLSGASVTPTVGGNNLTVTVDDGSGHTGSATIATINNAPVANPASYNCTPGLSVGIQITGAGGLASDADADVLTVTATTPTKGTAQVIVIGADSYIYYLNNGTTGADSFDYTVDDGTGGTDTATISITVGQPNEQSQNKLADPELIGGGPDVRLKFLGIPGYTYALEWTHDLTPTITWTALSTNTASGNGLVVYTNTPSGGADFYRTRWVP